VGAATGDILPDRAILGEMMFNSAILDVAIGLVFIFLLVSLLVSAAAEMISGWLKWRSVYLWDGLEKLLQSREARNELYEHPLIKGLTKVNVAAADWAGGRNGPSYIPSRTFALALVDILRQPHKVVNDLEGRLQTVIDDVTRDPSKLFASIERIVRETSDGKVPEAIRKDLEALRARLLPSIDPATTTALKQQVQAVLDRMPQAERAAVAEKVSQWLEKEADTATTYPELQSSLTAAIGTVPFAGTTSAPEQLRTALDGVLRQFAQSKAEEVVREIRNFSKESVRRWLDDATPALKATVTALSPLAHDAAGDIDRFRENIEIWFNDGMDRVSGWYKRHTTFIQGVIALVLAVFLNIDALQIMRTLWREPTLRQSLVANAESLANTPQSPMSQQPAPQKPASEQPAPRQPASEQPESEQQPLPKPGSEQPTANQATDDGKIHLNLTDVRLFPDGVARVTLKLPTSTMPNGSAEGATLRAGSGSGRLLFGETSNDISAKAITMLPNKGAREVEFFVKAAPVTQVTPERVDVTWQPTQDPAAALVLSEALVLTPTASDDFAALQKQIGGLGLPIGWSCPAESTSGAADPGTTIGGPFWCTVPPGNSGRRWTSASWLGVTGWSGMRQQSFSTLTINKATALDRLGMLLTMMFGWLITAAAASLGAPFWFDSLKRVISIRSSGKAPEERPLSPKEVSQPREPGQRPKEADLLNALKR